LDRRRSAVVEAAKNAAKRLLKRGAKRLILKALAATSPFWVPAAATLIIALVILIGVYGAVSATGDLDGDGAVGENDTAVQAEYKRWADHYSGKPISVNELEREHRIPWGLLFALDFFEAELKGKELDSRAEETAERLAPRFEYKSSTIRVVTRKKVSYTDENGNKKTKWETDVDEREVKLLVRADTYRGIYEYSYERETTVSHPSEDCTIKVTRDVLIGVDYAEDWSRLESEMAAREIPVTVLERRMVVELGDGLTEKRLALEWMLEPDRAERAGAYIGEIPPEYLEWFKEAGERYGVLWHVLAAVAKVESSFNPEAVGPPNSTGELARGMMQFLPSTWEKFGVDADGDGVKNPFSAKDAIFGAARYLAHSLKEAKGDIEKALYAYNRSKSYVERVLSISRAYRVQEIIGLKGYAFPVAGPWRITSYFGEVSAVRNNQPHQGVDFAADAGTPVLAVIGGVVEDRGYDSIYGNRLVIAGADGNRYLYAHLMRFEPGLMRGSSVAKGQVIGYVGNTGRSTGPHLHLGVEAGGRWIDPLRLFR